MSDTIKKYRDKTYKAKDRKKYKDVKHFGNTSGTHSRKTDGPAVPGKDYVKYGWPFEMRKPQVIKNLQDERNADEQIDEIKKWNS
jgi:hypothetical protein